MSAELAAKLKRGREFKIDAGHFFGKEPHAVKLLLRRPSDAEFRALAKVSAEFSEIAASCVVGWEGEVIENDIVGGGGTDPIVFTPLLWREFISDRGDMWEAIADPVVEAYRAHQAKLNDAAKNSQAGSN